MSFMSGDRFFFANVFVLLLICNEVYGLAKANLPASELVNRRKSPALWREDLTASDVVAAKSLPIPKSPPEIMSPVGGWPQLKAAVGNGADSIYLGLSSYSARARAANFNPFDGELEEAVTYCHGAGVKVYVALNTLVFDQELSEVETLIRATEKAGVDALIVQDIGVAQIAKRVAPSLELHASTQQTITSADGAEFAAERSASSRVVLGRELSVKEIEGVTAELSEDIEIEAFVHGALCVSYSGQCFSSEAWGGRSANRGQCAQACRLPYGLIVGGELKELEDMTYLLSPQDLCGIEQVPGLVRAGVSCLKIEGRLKDEAYVAATTRAYRNAVDEAWASLQDETGTGGRISTRAAALESQETVTKAELAQMFARGQDEDHDGLTPGFFEGSKHQRLVRGRSPRHRGVHVGRVLGGSSWRNGLIISTDIGKDQNLKRGDGLVIDRGMAEEFELGGPIFDVEEIRDGLVVRFGREVEKRWRRMDEDAKKGLGTRQPLAPEGAHVWKTSDATVEKKMRRLIEAGPPRMLVEVDVSGKIDEPLMVRITDASGRVGMGTTENVLAAAEKNGLGEKSIRKAVGTLGNTRWAIEGDVNIDGLSEGVWCPMSWVKDARRKAVESLETLTDKENPENVAGESTVKSNICESLISEKLGNDKPKKSGMRLSVLARTYDQVDAICRMFEDGEPIYEVIIDFLEVDGMREAMTRARETDIRVVVASPRIIKPGEEGIWRTLLRLDSDGLLVRSSGLLYRMTKLGGSGATVNVGSAEDEQLVKIPELIGDFSLNAANVLTALELLDSGLSRVTAAYDLNANAITELAETMAGKSEQLEVVAHAHLPIFHTEHCVFARFLSKGDSYVDCGHVCTRNNVHLRDETGSDNLVLADMGCRNTVFSSQAQSGVHSIGEWGGAGLGHIRIELIDQDAADSARIVSGYLGVISGEQRASDVWESLKEVKDSNGRAAGVGHGSFDNRVERRAGEVLH